MYNAMKLPGITSNVPAKGTAARKFPLQFLCNWANGVIDKETSELMEYKHLLQNPKHRPRWQRSFSKEIWRLAMETETINFVSCKDIPKERLGDIIYARIVCTEQPEKKDPDRT